MANPKTKKTAGKKAKHAKSGDTTTAAEEARGSRQDAAETGAVPETEAKAAPAEPKAKKKAKARPEKPAKKTSALDAAAKVLAEKGEPMNCKEMIEAMAAKGYWQSPGGKTPEATLYSALLREMKVKGKEARFHKVTRGQFALRPTA